MASNLTGNLIGSLRLLARTRRDSTSALKTSQDSVRNSECHFLGFAFRFRPRSRKRDHLGKRLSGMRCRANEPRLVRPVSNYHFVDSIFQQLTLLPDNADKGNFVSNARTNELFQHV